MIDYEKNVIRLIVAAMCCMLFPIMAGATTYIKEIAISADGDEQKAKNHLVNAGYTPVNGDLNRSAGGKFIFLGYKTTENYGDAITHIIVEWNKEYNNGITVNGKLYRPIKHVGQSNGDCSQDSKGAKEHFYIHYTKSGHSKGEYALTGINVVYDASKSNVGGYKGSTPAANSNRDDLHQDLNRGNNGPQAVFLQQTLAAGTKPKGTGTAADPYQLTNIADLQFFQGVVNGDSPGACAILMNDIDMQELKAKGKSWEPIGGYKTETGGEYSGIFNGQGHTIRNLYGNSNDYHDMGFIGRSKGCTVKNLIIVNADLKGLYRSAPIIGSAYGNTTIANCGVQGTLKLAGNSAGLAYHEFLDSEKDKKITVSNSYTVYGNLVGTSPSDARNKINFSYCGKDVTDFTNRTSGKLCHDLNDKSDNTAIWYQKIGVDSFPTLDMKSPRVYKTGIIYHNELHPFGGRGDGSVNNPFPITSGEDLALFKKYVNQGYNTISAYLMADIDYSSHSTLNDMIGTSGYPFSGTFNGNGKEILIGFNVATERAGLFRFIQDASIANLQITGSLTTSRNIAGILVGSALGEAAISHVIVKATLNSSFSGDSSIGGFVGEIGFNNTSTKKKWVYFDNCAFEGSIIAPTSHSCGGFAGWLHGDGYADVKNCLMAPQELNLQPYASYTFIRCYAPERYKINEYCYYDFEQQGGTAQGTRVTEKQAKSGELCFLLNGRVQNNITWLQTLGKDEYPTLWNSKPVYYLGDTTYVNYKAELPGSGTLADPFLIGSPQDLEYFRDLVNGDMLSGDHGLPHLCARLTANIDMSDRNWWPIGYYYSKANYEKIGKVYYQGTFDGDGFIISNLSGKSDGNHNMGLIGGATDGCHVMNLLMYNVHLESIFRCAPIIGYYDGMDSAVVENCGVMGLVVLRDSLDSDEGGIATSERSNIIVRNCFTTFDRNVVGYLGGKTYQGENCYYRGDKESFDRMAKSGELCYRLNGSRNGYSHWKQTLDTEGSQPYPLQRTGQKVEFDGTKYTNVKYSAKDNTMFSGNMSSDYFRVVHHGGRLYEFIITLGIKDGSGEHPFPNMNISYKQKGGAWVNIANLSNINREQLPFGQDWSGEISIKRGTFFNARTWQDQTPVFWITQGNHTTRKDASLLWVAPNEDGADDLKDFKTSNEQGQGLLVAGSILSTDDVADGNAIVVNPTINIESSDVGSTLATVTTLSPVYSLGVWDATENRFISMQEIQEGTQSLQVSIPHRNYSRDITLFMFALKPILTGLTVDTTYFTSAVSLTAYPIHDIRHANNSVTLQDYQSISWAINYPKAGDLMEDDQFIVRRGYKSDYSDLDQTGNMNVMDGSTIKSENDSLGWFTQKIEADVRNAVKTTSAVSVFDDWNLPNSAYDILGKYQFNASYVYYEVFRAIPHEVWSTSDLYYKRWKVLLSKMLPRVDRITLDTTAQFNKTHKVRLRLELDNPYPQDLVSSDTDKQAVGSEALKRGFGRMFVWDENASITITRYSPETEHYMGIDEAEKTIVVKGKDVKQSDDRSHWYVELTDIQSLPDIHYYYRASVDTTSSIYSVCKNMKEPARTTDAEATKCYTNSLAPILNLKAVPDDKTPGQVNLTWETDNSENNTVTLLRIPYQCAYSDTVKLSSEKEALATGKCSAKDPEALAGIVYQYIVKSEIVRRGVLHDTSAVTYGYSNYRLGKISGHVRMADGTAMPGNSKVNIKCLQKLQLKEVKDPSGKVVMTGYQCADSLITVAAEEDGSYGIDSLCYYGTGVVYEASAQCDGATFVGPTGTSAVVQLTLEDARCAFSAVDFICNSTHQFTGRVLYEGSTIPVSGIKFKVNGKELLDINGDDVKTDSRGNFALTLPKYALTLQAYKENHKLSAGGWIFGSEGCPEVPNQDYQNMVIYDSTKIRVVGRIVGGDIEGAKPLGFGLSENILGDNLQLVLQLEGDNTSSMYNNTMKPEETSRTEKFVQTVKDVELKTTESFSTEVVFQRKSIIVKADEETGEFCLDLAPAKYKISKMYADGYSTLYNEGEGIHVLDLTDCDLIPVRHTAEVVKDGKRTGYQTEYVYVYDHVYHAPARLTLKQNGQEFFGDEEVSVTTLSGYNTFKTAWTDMTGVHYTFGHPVFTSKKSYNFIAEAMEEYHYNNIPQGELNRVPVSNRKVTVVNGFSSSTQQAEFTLNDMGMCGFSIVPDHTTFSFTGDDALMTMQASVEINGYSYEAEPLKAFIMGECQTGVEIEAAMTAKPQLLDVIRDPYGANSYAYRESGTTYTWSAHYEKDYKRNFSFTVKTGFAFLLTVGIGYSNGSELEISTPSPTWNFVIQHDIDQEDGEYQLTLRDRISTSSDPHDVGAMADIYIGSVSTVDIVRGRKFSIVDSTTYSWSEEALRTGAMKLVAQGKNDQGKDEYLVVADAVGAAPGKERTFVYTQKYILGTLIPNLERRRSMLSSTDSIEQYTARILEWQDIVKENEQVKVKALEAEADVAYSISGATIEHSEEGSSYYHTASLSGAKPYTFSVTAGGGDGKFRPDPEDKKDRWKDYALRGWGFLLSASFTGGSSVSATNSVRNYKTTIGGSGYSLTTTDNSYIDMDVVMMKDETLGTVDKEFVSKIDNYELGGQIQGNSYKTRSDTLPIGANSTYVNNYVFIQRGGASRNPWCDADSTFFYKDASGNRLALGARSLRIDNPKIYVENPVVNNQPQDEAAIFTIRLANETEINDKSKYLNPSTLYLNVDEASNPYGAQLKIDGQPLRNSMQFFLNPGESVVKTLEVTRGGKPYNYDNIKLLFTDDPNYWKLIDDAVISVHYVPTSSPVNLSQPSDNWLLNTVSQQDEEGRYYIPVQIDGFSTSKYDNFDHIELQYKKQTESESQWVNICSFYDNDSLYEQAEGIKAMIPESENRITYKFYGEKDPIEMKYDLRAVSLCSLGTGYISKTSKVVSGTKDTRCPEVFGKPKPANGILTFSDVISLPFSEPIAYNYLDETANFSVQGYTNTSDADHSAFIYFPGSDTQSAKTVIDAVANDIDLTIELMVKMDEDAQTKEQVNFIEVENTDVSKTFIFGYLPVEDRLFVKSGETIVKSLKLKDKNFYLTKSMTHVALLFSAEEGTARFFVVENDLTDQAVSQKITCRAKGPILLGNGYKGAMSDVRIWGRLLTDSEVTSKYKKVLSVSERNLSVYWPMDETRDNILIDKVSGMNIRLNDVSWQTPRGYSVRLEGQPLTLTGKAEQAFSRNNTEDYTLAFWFKCDDNVASNNRAMLFSAGSNVLSEKGMNKMRIGFNSGEDISASGLVLKSEGNTIPFGAGIDELNATWHHVAVSVNHSQNVASLFLDGVMTNEVNAEEIGGITGTALAFGDSAFSGNIDNVTLWTMSLPASYIKGYYNVGCSGSETGLLINMNFEQTLTDDKGIPYTAFSPFNNVKTGMFAGDTLVYEKTVKADEKMYAPVRTGAGLENLAFSWTSNGNELQININKTDASINNQQINLVVRDVEDLNGNVMKNPQMWSVYVNRNVLSWEQDRLDLELDYGSDTTFTLGWLNTSGRVISYVIDNNATWLQFSDVMGSMQPLSSDYTTVHIADGLAPGSYSTLINLIDENGLISKLRLNVSVWAEEPEWTVEDDYDCSIGTMGIIGIVRKQADGGRWTVDMNPYDIVAAFVNNSCIGKCYVKVDAVKNTSAFYLSLVGDSSTDDENIEFRLWSADEGKIFKLQGDSTITFKRNKVLGVKHPLELRTYDEKYQNIDLKRGWNWVSLNVKPAAENNANNLFCDISKLSAGDILKSRDKFSTLQTNGMWDSYLDEMEIKPSNVYQIYAHYPCTIVASGTAFSDNDRKIYISFDPKENWSDFAYLMEVAQPINEALTDFVAGSEKAPAGTILKSRDEFAVATEDGRWVGSLEYLRPGAGYYVIMDVTEEVEDSVLFTNTIVSDMMSVAPYVGDVAAGFNGIETNSEEHATSMPVMATFTEGEYEEGDLLLAIADKKVVGVAAASVLEQETGMNGEPIFFLTVNAEEGSKLTFVKMRNGEAVAVGQKGFNYDSRRVAGSLKNPYKVDFTKVDEEYIYDVIGLKYNDLESIKARMGVFIINGEKVLVK